MIMILIFKIAII